MRRPESIPVLLQERASSRPKTKIFGFLADGKTENEALNYADLDRRARAIAHALNGVGRAGDRVLLCLPYGTSFITGLLGAWYAGRVAAIPDSYNPNNKEESLARIDRM